MVSSKYYFNNNFLVLNFLPIAKIYIAIYQLKFMGQTEALREVQKIAKELKAKDPKLKHTDAVSKAWKVYKAKK